MSTPEAKVKAKVNAALKPLVDKGVVWKFMPVQTGYGTAALDYLLCVNGRFIVIETKEAGKNFTARQRTTAQAMCAAGALVFKVDDRASLDKAMGYILKCL
jgi:hypothetical protein